MANDRVQLLVYSKMFFFFIFYYALQRSAYTHLLSIVFNELDPPKSVHIKCPIRVLI